MVCVGDGAREVEGGSPVGGDVVGDPAGGEVVDPNAVGDVVDGTAASRRSSPDANAPTTSAINANAATTPNATNTRDRDRALVSAVVDSFWLALPGP